MSSNIHDTNVKLIYSELQSLINDTLFLSSSDELLQQRLPHIYTTSPTLFKMISSNKDKIFNNDKSFFDKIHLMLFNIFQIQSNNITQHKASEIIGTNLAQEFIDVCKK
jgi:hypothetical protein